MKIVFFSNIPAPYCVSYLNELGKLAEVTAVFEKEYYEHRDKSWQNINAINFKFIILRGFNIGKTNVLALSAIKFIEENRESRIIIANPLTPTGIACIQYCKINKIPYILQSEGGIPKDGKGLKEHFKKYILSGAQLYLSGMGPKHEYFVSYGAKPETVKQYPFASLYAKDLVAEVPTQSEKEELKRELQIAKKYMLVFVGAIIHRKGIDVFIKACKGLADNVGVYLVGGKPTEEYNELAREYNLNNIHYIEHIQLTQLRKYYLAADIFVFPTRYDTWGLVINEAMSYGLPVITTENCVAGVELIEDDVNGYVISNEDSETLHEKIEYLIKQPDLRRTMAANNINKIKGYTFENMAKVIYRKLNEIN